MLASVEQFLGGFHVGEQDGITRRHRFRRCEVTKSSIVLAEPRIGDATVIVRNGLVARPKRTLRERDRIMIRSRLMAAFISRR